MASRSRLCCLSMAVVTKNVFLRRKNKTIRIMCRYYLTVDDALIEKVRPHIDKNVAIQSWLEDMLQMALMNYAEQFSKESKIRSEQICQQVKALGDTPEGFFNLHKVLKPSRYSAEELKDEYISEKYGV